MAGESQKREEKQHIPKIPLVPLKPLVPRRGSLVPRRPSLVPIKPLMTARLAQLVEQADSAPLEILRNKSTYLPKVA